MLEEVFLERSLHVVLRLLPALFLKREGKFTRCSASAQPRLRDAM